MSSEEKFIIARWAYAIGEEFIGDVEYDYIEQEIKSKGLLLEYTGRGWSEDPCPYELLKRYGLDEFIVPAIYSHSTESIESLNSSEVVKEKLSLLSKVTRISYKLDGFSLRLNYYNGRLVLATTRNRNGGKAKNLDKLLKLFKPTIELKGKVLITGELYLKNNRIEEYKVLRGIVSQRNGVSTAIANGDVEFLEYRCYNIYASDLDVFKTDKYKLLQTLGFFTPKNIMVKDYNSLMKGIDILGKQKVTYGAPTDGVVLENDTMQYALRIGAWEEECNRSYVTGYIFNRGMYGNSISVEIKPLVLENKTQYKVDITNVQAIIDNDLMIGSPIVFVERSAVNSILDITRTEELQRSYCGRYEEYRKEIDEYAK